MKRAFIAWSAAVPLALFTGFASLGTVGVAQDNGLDRIFDRDRDRDRGVFDRDRPFFERDGDELPTGATLLGADQAECEGGLVAAGIGRDGGDLHGVRQGEVRVFDVADQVVPWACLSARSAHSGVMECPNGTTDVRISRDGNVARFECYGLER